MSSRLRTAALAAALAASQFAVAEPSASLTLRAGPHTFHVEVADTPGERQVGVMGRPRLGDDAGMLFVFEQRGSHCFWMKNTLVPLSIAFLADDGSIVHIADMQPQTLDFHCPPTAVRYALEVKQGGFERRGIGKGSRVTGGPFGASR
jgi:hypothetical protein